MAKTRLNKDEIAPKNLFENIEKGAEAAEKKVDRLTESLKLMQNLASKLKVKVSNVNPKDVKSIEELNKAAAKSNELAKNRLQVNKELQKERLKLQQLNRERNKMLREEITMEQKQVGTLEKLKVSNAQLRREREKLNITTKAGRARLQEINREIDRNNAFIEKNSDKLKKQKIGIGRYEKAAKALTGTLTKLGLSFGAFTIIRSGFETVRDFEAQIADLSAITGLVGKDLDNMKDKALDFSTQFGMSAADITEAFKLAGSARPELLANGDALADLTEKAIILSKASGDDVPTSIQNLTGTLNAFNLDASDATHVMDVLANASQKGAKEIPFLTEAFTKFGGTAAAMNVNVNESAAAIEFLGKKIPAASDAGVRFRNVLSKISSPDILPKKALEGFNKLGISLETLKDDTLPLQDRLAELKPLLNDGATLSLAFGLQNKDAARELIANSEAIGKFSEELDEGGTTLEQAEIKSKTLGEAVNKLKATWDAAIIRLVDGTGASKGLNKAVDGLTKAVKFLVDNMDTIIAILGKVVKAFVIWKATMKALKLQDQIKELKAFNKKIADTGKAAESAGKGVKNFGRALKGLALSAAITLLIEVAQAWYDIASGAKAARLASEAYEKQVTKGTEKAQALLKSQRAALEDQVRAIKAKNLGQDEENRLIRDANKIAKDNIGLEIKRLDVANKAAWERQKAAKAELEAFEANKANQAAMLIAGSQAQITWAKLTGELAGANAEAGNYTGQLKVLRAGQEDLVNTVKDLDTEIERTENSTKDVKKENEKLLDIKEDELDITKEIGEERRRQRKEELEFRKFLEGLLKEADAQRAADLPEVEGEDILPDADEYKRRLNARYLELLKSNKSQKEIDKELTDFEIDLLQERIDARKSLGFVSQEFANETTELEIELLEKVRDKEADLLAERAENMREWVDFSTELFTKGADERIAKLEEEAEAAQKLADQFREQAAQGNITAKESLAEQNRIIAEANAEKERQEQRKQQILAASAVMQAYISNLEGGDDSTTAFAKALTSKELIDILISSIPAFMDGIEDTGKQGRGVDGKGGFLSVLHPNERVLTKEQNSRVGNISNEDLATIAESYRLGEFVDGTQINVGWDNHLLVDSLLKVEDKLDKVNETIANKPENSIEAGKIIGGTMHIIEKTKKGNFSTQRRFKVSAK